MILGKKKGGGEILVLHTNQVFVGCVSIRHYCVCGGGGIQLYTAHQTRQDSTRSSFNQKSQGHQPSLADGTEENERRKRTPNPEF